MYFKEIRGY